MNTELRNQIISELPEGEVFHVRHAVNPDHIVTENFEIVFILKGTGELEDISINPKGDQEGFCWDYSNDDIDSELAVLLCKHMNRTEWLNDLNIDFIDDSEIYWGEDNRLNSYYE